jgi:hypothetical protein
MIEREGIRVLGSADEPDGADDADAVGFEDSELPILHRADDGWRLRYRDDQGTEQEHLVTGGLDDEELAVHQARAWLDSAPRTTAWPHHQSPGL